MLETLNESGVEAALDRIHPDFAGVTPPELSPEPDTYRGHDGVRRYFAGYEGVMDQVRGEEGGRGGAGGVAGGLGGGGDPARPALAGDRAGAGAAGQAGVHGARRQGLSDRR